MNYLFCLLRGQWLATALFFLAALLPAQTTGPAQPLATAQAERLLQTMDLRQKIAQLFFIHIRQYGHIWPITRWNGELDLFIKKYPVGGIILFRTNLRSKNQLQTLLKDARNSFKTIPPFLAVDEEGGAISRLKNLPGLQYDGLEPALNLSQTGDRAEAVRRAATRGLRIGQLLAGLGFSLNMAPVADLLPSGLPQGGHAKEKTSAIGSRAFSSDPATAAAMVAAFVAAMQKQGVGAVLKHFPGHGHAWGDPHKSSSIYRGSLAQWQAEGHAQPFIKGLQAGAGLVMLGHFSLPAVTQNNTPASLNPYVINQMLRRDLGFNGVIISDSLDMRAIKTRWDSATSALLFLQAGGDMILMPPNPLAALQGIESAVKRGELSETRLENSVRRVLFQKIRLGLLVHTTKQK